MHTQVGEVKHGLKVGCVFVEQYCHMSIACTQFVVSVWRRGYMVKQFWRLIWSFFDLNCFEVRGIHVEVASG